MLNEGFFSAFGYSSLPLTKADIGLLYDDFALGRSFVPPHAACARPALVCWDPRAPLSLENCVVAEMKDLERVMCGVFLTPGALFHVTLGLTPPGDYVDALGGPIDPARLTSIVMQSPEEVWGVEAARVA